MAEQQQTFVIVGASLTGAKAAQTLRRRAPPATSCSSATRPNDPTNGPAVQGYLTDKQDKAKLYVRHEG